MAKPLSIDSAHLLDHVVKAGRLPTADDVGDALTRQRLVVARPQVPRMADQVIQELTGYGELQSLMRTGVTDVLVNAPDSVWIDSDSGLERTGIQFADEAALRRLATRLALQAGARLDDAKPFVDAVLPDGVRLQACLHPIAARSAQLCLRLPCPRVLSLSDWQMKPSVRKALSALPTAQHNFVVSGLTGAGKTTLLRTLLHIYSPRCRIVILEDVAELNLDLPNIVTLQARSPNAEGAGAVPLRDLVRQSLRMRPDSIVLGEVRGPEVLEWLLTISTGHLGSATTVHAADPVAALRRLLLLAELAGLPRAAAKSLITGSVDFIVQCDRDAGVRAVTSVTRVCEVIDAV